MATNGSANGDMKSFKDILPICLDSFLRDFSFVDIAHYCTPIFTEQEIAEILSEAGRESQTLRMFFILYGKDANQLNLFEQLLRVDYFWLSKLMIDQTEEIHSKETQTYLNAVLDLRRSFPKYLDVNVHRLKYYWDLRSKLKKLKRRNHLILCGELGFGKKWIALDACSDYSVMKAMNFRVYWLDMHNCDSQERELEILQRLKLLLGESDLSKKTNEYEGISNKILEIQQELRCMLEQENYKDCLLVLADVPNKKTLDAFSLRCKILITTRNKTIANHLPKVLSETINVREGMTHAEGLTLFEKALNQKRSRFPKNANDIFDKSRGHPFLLNIIAQNLKQKSHNWNEWISNLCEEKITDNKINTIILLSLSVLTPEELGKYEMFGIFHHSIKIPVKILAYLWEMTQRDAEDLVVKFDKFSLITKTQFSYDKFSLITKNQFPDKMACSLHFLYHSYLKNFVKIDRKTLNQKVVESYRLETALHDRQDVDLIDLPNDFYFHHFIGYHLREAEMTELFSKLYLDLGFLGQKLRATYLANTIGDLKYFRKEITGGDNYKEELVDSLLSFLPIIEETIFKSEDTTLLQNALMSEGILQAEAYRQAEKFSDNIWFSERGHFHHRRQMIILHRKPKILKLIQADSCIIGLDDNTLMLDDLSLGYSMERTIFKEHQTDIIDIEVFSETHFLTLDRTGTVCIWSIADERRRSVTRKQSTRLIANHIDLKSLTKLTKKSCKQAIRRDINGQAIPIQHFYIQHYENLIQMHLAYNNGDIIIYEWNQELEKFIHYDYVPTLHTRIKNIRFLTKLHEKYYMVVDNTGSLKFYNLKDSSIVTCSFEWPTDLSNPIRIHEYYNANNYTVVIFVFSQRILRVTFPPNTYQFVNGLMEVLYEITDRHGAINCSTLSEDNRYLVLGTKQGIVVFDVVQKVEVLRNNYSAAIVCIDIYSLDDKLFKYVIVSGSKEQPVLNIFALKDNGENSVTWSHGNGTLVWLQGKKLFDVSYNLENSNVSIVAVDSKNQIHQLLPNQKDWSITVPYDHNSSITAITGPYNGCFYGLANGSICNLKDDKFHLNLPTAITYLQLIEDNILVASSLPSEKCLIYYNEIEYEFDFGVVACYTYSRNYLILLNDRSHLKILSITADAIVEEYSMTNRKILVGDSDFKENILAIGTRYFRIYVYKFTDSESKPQEIEYHRRRQEDNPIKSLALSSNGSIMAVGLEQSSDIEIYRIDTDNISENSQSSIKLLQVLNSHKSPVYDLKFSPWNDLYLPTILVSCSDQLCFWDISYALNNPIEQKKGFRHSSRFNSSTSVPTMAMEQLAIRNSINTTVALSKSAWMHKKGPSDKPELLACIKFVGSKAEKIYASEDFENFSTIDDEGVYYNLAVHNFHENNHDTSASSTEYQTGNEDDDVYI